MAEQQKDHGYTPLPQPVRITEQHWPDGTVPLVTIRCTTYNHVNFIRDAIEGFLMQETTFPVEILIHDDASNDGTADIVREYEAKYPKLIKPVFQAENQYSKGNKPSQFLQKLTKGQYIAVCEGDDYWTDPAKIEIQVNYLESHPDCVISGHDAFIVDEHGMRVSDSKLPDSHKRDYTAEDLLYGRAWILTMSCVYRNVLPSDPIPERMHIKNGDNLTTSLLGQFGGSKYHFEIKPACYRRHQGGIWSMLQPQDKENDRLNSYFWIYRYWERVDKPMVAAVWFERWSSVAISRMGRDFLLRELVRRVAIGLGARRVKAILRALPDLMGFSYDKKQ